MYEAARLLRQKDLHILQIGRESGIGGARNSMKKIVARVGGPGMVRFDPIDAGVDKVFKTFQCGDCGVEIAILGMNIDEVYHFFYVVSTFFQHKQHMF